MKKLFLLPVLFCAAVLSAGLKPVNMDMIDCNFDSDINWQRIGDNICNLAEARYVTATEKITPYSKDFTFEMQVKPLQKIQRSAGDSGVCISSHLRGVIWRVLLVDNNKSRIAKMDLITERPGSTKVRKTIKCIEGSNFKWDYKKVYTMRIGVKDGKITASIAHNGKVAARFTADESFNEIYNGGLFGGAILSEFSNSAASHGKAVAVKEPEVKLNKPKYVPYSNISKKFKAKATGYFYTKQDETGRWWLIDPVGNAMFACGTDAVNWHGRHCEALGYCLYHRSVRAIFDTEMEWLVHTKKRLDSWGFNYAGTCTKLFYQHIPFANNLMIGSTFASLGDEYDICPYQGHVGTALPNPFHPRFGEYAKKRYIRNVGGQQENPYFLGYYCDNELRWAGMTHAYDGSGVFDTVLKKNSRHTAKIALVKFMRERYKNDVAAMNKAWGSSFKSFDDLLNATELKHSSDDQLNVKLDFLTFTAETYFKTLRDSLREIDPNHLFLGCRYAGTRVHKRIWEANAKYCDVVSFNVYPTYDKIWNQMFIDGKPATSVLDHVYSMCNKPMMITEWAFMGLDSGLPCTRGAGQRFYTQDERAHAASIFYRMMLGHKAMIGSSWYEFGDDPFLGVRRRHPENSNYGLVNKDDVPYEKLVNTFKEINRDIDGSRQYNHVSAKRNPAGKLYQQFNKRSAGKSGVKSTFTETSFEAAGKNIKFRTTVRGWMDLTVNGKYIAKMRGMLNTSNVRRAWTMLRNPHGVKVNELANGVEVYLKGDAVSANGKGVVTMRFFIPAEGQYVTCELVNVKNTGKEPLVVGGFYFQMWPSFRALPPDPNVSAAHYTGWNKSAWECTRGDYVGFANTTGKFRIAFMDHPEDGLKADAAFYIVQNVAPGAVYTPAEPAYIFLYAGNGAWRRAADKLIKADLAE